MRAVLIGFLITGVVAAQPARRDDPHPVRVTVVVIAASSKSTEIDERLGGFAAVIQKTNPNLTGFKIVGGDDVRIKTGENGTFKLDGTEELKVRVDRPRDQNGSIGLTVFPPGAAEISYSCTSGKFVPFVTEVTTKAGDKILVAVMARPDVRRKK